MKLSNLIGALQAVQERSRDDLDVVIPISSPGVGGRPNVGISFLAEGADWDSGKLFLLPAKKLVVKTDKEAAFDAAVEFLMWLATKPTKRLTYEITTARNILDGAGIEYMKHQKFLHQDKF